MTQNLFFWFWFLPFKERASEWISLRDKLCVLNDFERNVYENDRILLKFMMWLMIMMVVRTLDAVVVRSTESFLFLFSFFSLILGQARLAQIDLFADGGLREASVLRYKEKRRTRLFSKKIRYQVRKVNADRRPRMKV